MKISKGIKDIVSTYNFPEGIKAELEKELQEYVDKRVNEELDKLKTKSKISETMYCIEFEDQGQDLLRLFVSRKTVVWCEVTPPRAWVGAMIDSEIDDLKLGAFPGVVTVYGEKTNIRYPVSSVRKTTVAEEEEILKKFQELKDNQNI